MPFAIGRLLSVVSVALSLVGVPLGTGEGIGVRNAGQTYYVSTSGDDDNDGLSDGAPFATVSKVNSLDLQPGDRVLFKCGDVWRVDPLIITESGSDGNPITFGAYPANCEDKPVLSGARPIRGWALHNGSVYAADLSTGDNEGKFAYGINQLFRDGERLAMGRWPNLNVGGRRLLDH
jgi:hypothetical protein